jgi:hypothetical protein
MSACSKRKNGEAVGGRCRLRQSRIPSVMQGRPRWLINRKPLSFFVRKPDRDECPAIGRAWLWRCAERDIEPNLAAIEKNGLTLAELTGEARVASHAVIVVSEAVTDRS